MGEVTCQLLPRVAQVWGGGRGSLCYVPVIINTVADVGCDYCNYKGKYKSRA